MKSMRQNVVVDAHWPAILTGTRPGTRTSRADEDSEEQKIKARARAQGNAGMTNEERKRN